MVALSDESVKKIYGLIPAKRVLAVKQESVLEVIRRWLPNFRTKHLLLLSYCFW